MPRRRAYLALLTALGGSACAQGKPIGNAGGAGGTSGIAGTGGWNPSSTITSAAITSASSTGPTSVASTSVTSVSSNATTSSTTAASTSTGMTCTGSTPCTSVADCPTPPSDCVASACSLGCCARASKPQGSTCTTSGGHLCDASGQCVGCLTNTDCSSGDCHTGACYTCGAHGAQDACCPSGQGDIGVTGLNLGQSINSCDGRFTLVMQTDGNLVIYWNGSALWSTNTVGCGDHAVMQGDGNFVVYSSSNAGCWSSNTANNPGAYLTLQDDGNLVIYNGASIWASGTGGH